MAFFLWKLFRDRIVTRGRRIRVLIAAALPAVFFAGLFLAVNRLQSGDATISGYNIPGTGLTIPAPRGSLIGMAVLGNLLRQGIWLFGWPISYLFVPFARGRRALTLLWALLAAVLVYRLLVPKTFVSATGPTYFMEATPLLALATAAGVHRVRDWLCRHDLPRLRAAVAPALLAFTVTSLTMFVPIQVRNIKASCKTVHFPFTLLETMPDDDRQELVFANWLVAGQGISWHLFPPPPSPTLDDEILFVRIPGGRDAAAEMQDFWRRRFPDRRPWLYEPAPPGGTPRLIPLLPSGAGGVP